MMQCSVPHVHFFNYQCLAIVGRATRVYASEAIMNRDLIKTSFTQTGIISQGGKNILVLGFTPIQDRSSIAFDSWFA